MESNPSGMEKETLSRPEIVPDDKVFLSDRAKILWAVERCEANNHSSSDANRFTTRSEESVNLNNWQEVTENLVAYRMGWKDSERVRHSIEDLRLEDLLILYNQLKITGIRTGSFQNPPRNHKVSEEANCYDFNHFINVSQAGFDKSREFISNLKRATEESQRDFILEFRQSIKKVIRNLPPPDDQESESNSGEALKILAYFGYWQNTPRGSGYPDTAAIKENLSLEINRYFEQHPDDQYAARLAARINSKEIIQSLISPDVEDKYSAFSREQKLSILADEDIESFYHYLLSGEILPGEAIKLLEQIVDSKPDRAFDIIEFLFQNKELPTEITRSLFYLKLPILAYKLERSKFWLEYFSEHAELQEIVGDSIVKETEKSENIFEKVKILCRYENFPLMSDFVSSQKMPLIDQIAKNFQKDIENNSDDRLDFFKDAFKRLQTTSSDFVSLGVKEKVEIVTAIMLGNQKMFPDIGYLIDNQLNQIKTGATKTELIYFADKVFDLQLLAETEIDDFAWISSSVLRDLKPAEIPDSLREKILNRVDLLLDNYFLDGIYNNDLISPIINLLVSCPDADRNKRFIDILFSNKENIVEYALCYIPDTKVQDWFSEIKLEKRLELIDSLELNPENLNVLDLFFSNEVEIQDKYILLSQSKFELGPVIKNHQQLQIIRLSASSDQILFNLEENRQTVKILLDLHKKIGNDKWLELFEFQIFEGWENELLTDDNINFIINSLLNDEKEIGLFIGRSATLIAGSGFDLEELKTLKQQILLESKRKASANAESKMPDFKSTAYSQIRSKGLSYYDVPKLVLEEKARYIKHQTADIFATVFFSRLFIAKYNVTEGQLSRIFNLVKSFYPNSRATEVFGTETEEKFYLIHKFYKKFSKIKELDAVVGSQIDLSAILGSDNVEKTLDYLIANGDELSTSKSDSQRLAEMATKIVCDKNILGRDGYSDLSIKRDGEDLAFSDISKDEFYTEAEKKLSVNLNPLFEDKLEASERNRIFAEEFLSLEGEILIPEGSYLHTTSQVIPIINSANLAGECRGVVSYGRTDSYPGFIDLQRVDQSWGSLKISDVVTSKKRYASSFKWGIIYDSDQQVDSEPETSGHLGHCLVFAGMANTGVKMLITGTETTQEEVDQTKRAIAEAEIYIPIVSPNGLLLFDYNEYLQLHDQIKKFSNAEEFLERKDVFQEEIHQAKDTNSEITLADHLEGVLEICRLNADLFGISESKKRVVYLAAKLHDIGKLNSGGQEVTNIFAANSYLSQISGLNNEEKRQVLLLIKYDELFGEILKNISLGENGYQITYYGQQKIEQLEKVFADRELFLCLLFLYQADILSKTNQEYQNWQVAGKLEALGLPVLSGENIFVESGYGKEN